MRPDLLIEDRFSIVPEWLLDAEISDAAVRLYAVLVPSRTCIAGPWAAHSMSTSSVSHRPYHGAGVPPWVRLARNGPAPERDRTPGLPTTRCGRATWSRVSAPDDRPRPPVAGPLPQHRRSVQLSLNPCSETDACGGHLPVPVPCWSGMELGCRSLCSLRFLPFGAPISSALLGTWCGGRRSSSDPREVKAPGLGIAVRGGCTGDARPGGHQGIALAPGCLQALASAAARRLQRCVIRTVLRARWPPAGPSPHTS